jgi:ATP-binding protein involved in chromosome partitioning
MILTHGHVTGEIPLVPSVSSGGDQGVPVVAQTGKDGEQIRTVMSSVAQHVWRSITRG